MRIGGERLAALLMLGVALQACILPLPSETLHAVPEQAAGALVPGTSNRADVLGFPIPFAAVFQVSCHCLVVRFRPDGLVADLKQFDARSSRSSLRAPTWSRPAASGTPR